jgi:hypothetical protein
LRRPHDTVDEESRDVRRREAYQRDDRGRREPERELAPVCEQVPEQSDDDARLASRDERLRVTHRACDRRRIDAIGDVAFGDSAARLLGDRATGAADFVDGTAVQRLVEDEADVLDRTALAMRVAHDEDRRIARLAEESQGVRAQPRRFLKRAYLPALDRAHAPLSAVVASRECDVAGSKRKPRFAESQCVVQVGEGVELYGVSRTRVLDPGAQLAREARRLADVACNDFLIHVGDPLEAPRLSCTRGQQKGLSVLREHRKAGSRHRISGFYGARPRSAASANIDATGHTTPCDGMSRGPLRRKVT